MAETNTWRARFARLGEAAERRRRAILGSRWEFLAEAGAPMEALRDYTGTLARLVYLSVPTVADYCAIGVMDERGVVTWGSSAHRDPAKAELVSKLRSYTPNIGGMNHLGVQALLRGEPQLINTVDEAFLRLLA